MEEKNRHITRKVVWGYLLLLLIAVGAVGYVYSIIQQLAVEDAPDTATRDKTYLVTNTLTLLYESEAMGHIVGKSDNELYLFNRTLNKADKNLDSLRLMLTDTVQQLKVDTIKYLLKRKRWNTLKLQETLNEWNAGRIYMEKIQQVIEVQDSVVRIQKPDTISQPVVREIVEVKQDTVVVTKKKKKGFFRRLAEAFSPKEEVDTSFVKNTTRQLVTDTAQIVYNPSDTISQPVVREIVEVKQDTVVVTKKKKKGFFRRLAEAFSPKEEVDTSFVKNTTRQLVTDTAQIVYNPSDTIIQVLRNLQDTVADRREQLANTLLQRANNLRYNNSVLTSRINQMLRDIEEEAVQQSIDRMEHKQSLLKETTRLIGGIGLVAIVVAIVFLVIIIRDISRSHYYRQQLEKAKQYAEDLLRSRENLILTISHDIRAPLSSIIGFIDLLLKRNPDERQRYYLDNMTGSSKHILSLVNDLLDFHRLEAGQIEIHPVPFSVLSLIQEIYVSFNPLAEAKGLRLNLDVKPPYMELTYLGDTNRLRQVINNLLSNAVKFTPEGTVTLRAAITKLHDKQYELDVTVSDAGPGIPEAEQERIFGDFTRLQGSEKVEGFGLGLSITRRLVELLKGTLKVHSVVGQGSDFILTIPLPLSEVSLNPVVVEEAEEAAADPEPLSLAGERTVYCLLVDDDAIQLALTEELLKRSRVEVVGVSNPHAVLDILKNTSFDAIITDIQMPGMDGYHLLKMIRESGIQGTDQVPIIALSASVANEHSHYIEAGFTGFLNKPFTAVQLIELLNQLLTVHLEPVVKIDFSTLTAFAGEDEEASASILKTFTEETGKSIELLRKALAEEDRQEASRLSHKLIPLLTMLGANNLVQKLRILEKNDDELTEEGWKKLLAEVIDNVSDIVRQAVEKCG